VPVPPPLRFIARLTGVGSIAAAQARVADHLRACQAPERLVVRAELLFEEVVTNLLRHGFDAPGEREVGIEAAAAPDGCTLVFEDAGRPFDPTAAALPQAPARLADAPVGGLGLVLLRRTARRLAYVRLPEGRNRLTVEIGG